MAARASSVAAPPIVARYTGYADVPQAGVVTGWAVDAQDPNTPIAIEAIIDGHRLPPIVCDLPRKELADRRISQTVGGFSWKIPKAFEDGCPHVLRLFLPDQAPVLIASGLEQTAEEYPFVQGSSLLISGVVDGVVSGAIQGWAMAVDPITEKKSGSIRLIVSLDQEPIDTIVANLPRQDVARVTNGPTDVGFRWTPPARFRTGATHAFAFHIEETSAELTHSPIQTSILGTDAESRLAALETQSDDLLVQVWRLRSGLQAVRPAEHYTLAQYHDWALRYQADLRRRKAGAAGDACPLVSIICPIYRPRLPDFVAAVQSVVQQTYPHWELLLVDDASGDPALDACVQDFCARDPRIRALPLMRNSGISRATNRAIRAAKGAYIALFDHDDLLSPVALDTMVEAAVRTQAEVLYSDEDKIDDAGTWSEPHLKSDWNHRLLLSMNYVCHLLMVERAALRRAGAFNPAMDGAQDHDIALRLSEVVAQGRIHHVPEILYHWRKTPLSTAHSGDAKPYTIQAGQRAIAGHIERRGLSGSVRAMLNATLYAVDWAMPERPSVTIIIPFKDQAAVTLTCLRNVLATDYPNYNVVLVDNGSQTEAARVLTAFAASAPHTRVMRVDEPFNFSRLNNLATLHAPADFYLFLNNDVFVSDPHWLTKMVQEALVGPHVGVVGARLLYPSGLLQHAGVVLGVGGVADHCFSGLDPELPGYMSRAVVAQEFSAVTAACMLVRATAFEQVGRFDETSLKVAFNDVDLCLKIRQQGYTVVWSPTATAEHHESLSRGDDWAPSKRARFFHENMVMQDRWKGVIQQDPYYSRFFSRRSGIYQDLSAEALSGS